jgi:hypothetical protein
MSYESGAEQKLDASGEALGALEKSKISESLRVFGGDAK